MRFTLSLLITTFAFLGPACAFPLGNLQCEKMMTASGPMAFAAERAGVKFFLLPVTYADLNRFMNEYVGLSGQHLPEPKVDAEEGLYPISSGFPNDWLRTPAFGSLNIFSSDELSGTNSAPLIVSPKARVYVAIRANVLDDGPWQILNRWALEGNKIHRYTQATSASSPQQVTEELGDVASEHRLLGVVLMQNGIRRENVLGFVAPAASPELTKRIRDDIRSGKIHVPLIESNSMNEIRTKLGN